jgi:hypothetical protein
MADGTWKAIQAVVGGDLVLSPQPDHSVMAARVLAVAHYPHRPIYRIETNGRYPRGYRCAGDHRLPLLRSQAYWDHGRQRQARIFSSPAVELPAADLPVHPYVVGCLLGNGCLRPRGNQRPVQLTMPRMITISRMRRCEAQFGWIEYAHGAYRTRLVGAYRELITQQPYYGKLSRAKCVPEPYTRGSLEQRRWLLAGLIDTDGHVKHFASTSAQLAQDFAELMRSIGGWAAIGAQTSYYKAKPCRWYQVHFAAAEVSIPIQIRYKRQHMRDMAWKNPRNHSVRVTRDGEAKSYGITLASPSQWYITDDWWVTQSSGRMIMSLVPSHTAGGSMIPVHAAP